MDMYNANKTGIFGSAGKSDVDSKYESVTDQSGIYAGKEGFDINVGENTDLKGGIISSEAEKDKNKISTGTLTYEDIKNKAEYEAGSIGVNVDTSKDAEHKDAGVTPNIGVGAKDDAESTTKATVSEGEIEIRDKENQKQDLAGLNRDTKNSLNKLGEIFDKTKVEERQELAKLFGELAYNEIHKLSKINNWEEGCAEKNALHALVGGIMSELTDSGFLAGASGAMINEMIQDKLSDMFKDDPAMHQWASALIGGIVSQVVADNAQAGASSAASGTKNNMLWEHVEEFRRSIAQIDVSNLEEGYCRIVSFNGSAGEGASVGVSDAAIIFNTPDNDVYSSIDVTANIGVGPVVSGQIGIGWVEDPNGNIVTSPQKIRECMEGISFTTSGGVIAGVGSYFSGNGYKFRVRFAGTDVSFSAGGSYTKYLGPKDKVAKGEFVK